MRSSKTHAGPGPAAAFTLVELMIVIVIIALLVAIVLPSVSAARTSAKVAATKSLIYTLETGLQMFRSDDSVGRDYPPSRATAININPTNPDNLYGAQTMTLALAGFDLQGTRGFQPGSGSSWPTYSFSPDANGRKGPFVDVSKLQIIPSSQFGTGVFDQARNAPLVLDSFKMPVLYFKADMGKWGLKRYDRTDNQPIASNPDYLDPTKHFWDHFNDGVNSYISDPRINTLSGTPGPYNPDSFLLISAGPDQKFGTGDDVANFTVKPQ